MNLVEIKVPDIGGHAGVEVIEVLVKPGDSIAVDDALITLETDKATMEVPAPSAGVIKTVMVKVGSKISEGDTIITLEAATAEDKSTADKNVADKPIADKNTTDKNIAAAPVTSAPPSHSVANTSTYTGKVDIECEVLVLGGGPAGYSAAFRAADLGQKTVLVERYATLGGICLNVGCIPSKALLHNAFIIDEARQLAKHGINFAPPEINLDALRQHKESVVNKLTGGLAGMAKARKVNVVQGQGTFLDSHHLVVKLTTDARQSTGEEKVIKFNRAIIAAGSSVLKLPFIPDDPRVIDSTGALALPFIPQKMLIIGGGIIGLEMGSVYSSLGARLDVVEMTDNLMPGADRDLVKVWLTRNKHRFDHIMLRTKTVGLEPKEDGVWAHFEGENAPPTPQRYDLVLHATGRIPNGKTIDADKAGVIVNEQGFITVDKQQRTNIPHIYAIGDIAGQPMLAHKGVHEGHVAAENAADHKAYFDARVIPNVAYTDPEVAWVGVTEDQAKREGLNIIKSVFPWAASGRAIANDRDEGFTKLIFDAETKQLIGGAIVGLYAGDMIGEICLGIEMGADITDIGKTIHPHPTLGESIGMAAEVAAGICTDLPPQRKR
jgi:dihydrolipoamide dehydrogenase